MTDLKTYHNLSDLFAQLGLPNDAVSIDSFIQKNSPLPEAIFIWNASCFKPSQSAFLREALEENAEWAISVDELNVRLRKKI